VYASTMNENALAYRLHKGLLDKEERMGLLVQRVSGNFHEYSYFPQISGVGYSFNPFAWNKKIDPSKGVLRLVFGLGTRAVEQHAGDHTRIVAINQPLLRPEADAGQAGKYSQKIMDILNFNSNKPESVKFSDIAGNENIPALALFASKDEEMLERARQMNVKKVFPWILSFDKLLTSTEFIKDMGEILKTLENAYQHPVDIEYTANFVNEEEYRINILQCRPFHFIGTVKELSAPADIPDENLLLRTFDPLLGQSKYDRVGKIIYVEPERYSSMSIQDRYAVARLIGEITNHFTHEDNIMLIGPGRWGTAMPSLGIPVNFNEIKNVSVLCELAFMHENLSPDISLGTHFFNDLVEMQIMYMSMNTANSSNLFNRDYITGTHNLLSEIIPAGRAMADSVFVVDATSVRPGYDCYIHADTVKQQGMVFFWKRDEK
ncbi:MAG: PEP/pyruvate-binding domain-containing protein, partial [Victivallaceae bacterium]